jgi:hypothetical protein
MRSRLVPLAAALCLASAAPGRAADPQDPPQLVVAVKSLDGLVADLKYLAGAAGKEDDFKQLESQLQAVSGPDGLKGVDPKKPIGFYGRLDAKDPAKSDAVLLLPVADEKAVLDLLKGWKLTPEKGDDGVYKVTSPNLPTSFYFRFANKYVYVTATGKESLAPDRLPAPEAVLPAEGTSLLAVVARLDRIPDKYKEVALDAVQMAFAKAAEEAPPAADDNEKKVRAAVFDQMQRLAKGVLTDGGELKLSFDVDRKAGQLSATLSLSGKPGSPLAKDTADLAARKGVGASLVGADSALNVVCNAALPDKLRSAVGDAIEANLKKAMADEKDPAKRQGGEAFLKAFGPTLQAGELDGAVDLRGPGPKGYYTLLMGLKVKDGRRIEQLVRDALKDAPEKDREKIQFDVAKAGDVAIHRGVVDEAEAGPDFKKNFGEDRTVYFAFRADAILLALGEDGLAAIKGAATAAPKAGPVLQMQVATARVARLMAEQQKSAPEAAKKAFKDPDKDKFRLAVEGGPALTVRLSMDAQILAFGSLLDEMEKKGPDKGK